MKRQILVTILLLIASSANSQITISTFKSVSAGSVDSCYVPTAAGLASLPLFAPASGGAWNLSAVAVQATPVVYTYKAKTSGFPTGTYVDSEAVNVGGTAASLSYNTWRNIKQGASNVSLLGDEILKRQAKSLAPFTGNSVDSIVFPAQAIVYSRPLPLIRFPATIGTVWLDSAIRTLNFNLTVTVASLNNVPGMQVRRIRTLDSVVGWGQMKMPISGKAGSTWINVLQVHHYEISVDSFYLNGSPVSAAMLAQLGLAQGQSSTVAKTNFLRAAAVRPLLEVEHSSPSHSSSASRVYFNAIDLSEDLSVFRPGLGTVRVYPNPVRNGKLTIEAPGNAGKGLRFQLVNIIGQEILQSNLGSTGGIVQLPPQLPSGIYYLTLENSDQSMAIIPVEIQ